MLTFRYTGADGIMTVPETLTAGMVGKKVRLEFSEDWAGLGKTAVFMAGLVTRDAVVASDEVTIPAEVLACPRQRLYVGVYGVSAAGEATPTIRAAGPVIEPGAEPSGDPGMDPDLPVWAQIQGVLGRILGQLEDGVGGIHTGPTPPADTALLWVDTGDEGTETAPYYTVTVEQTAENLAAFAYTPSQPGMAELGRQVITLPKGEKGERGDSGAAPVRGIDYWTAEDVAQIRAYVDEAILGGAW